MYLGIDCGTQGTKVVLLDPETGSLVARGHASHPVIAEASGRREQKAEWWIAALRQALQDLFAGTTRSPADVSAIAVSGQQHGLVMLDDGGAVIRNVKLWNDTETAAVNEQLFHAAGGEKRIRSLIGTTIPVGFTASKVAWVRQHEPDIYAQMQQVLLPHDYINYWLTGECATDAGEASGTGYFDVLSRIWSSHMVDVIDPTGRLERSLPRIASPLEPIGTVRPEVAAEFGFSPGVLVACGSGDNVMGALGTGNVAAGRATLGLGTSGVLNLHADKLAESVDPSIYVFCGLDGGWLPTIATMNATSTTTLLQQLFEVEIAEVEHLIASASPGAGGVRMFPYFNGERIPALPRARAVMKGLSADNMTRANLMRAGAESVAFGLKWGYERLALSFERAEQFRLTGGGANSAAWRQILADVFDTDVIRVKCDEGGAYAAALLALTVHQRAKGASVTLYDVCERYVELDETRAAQPRPDVVALYKEWFAAFTDTIANEDFEAD
ncbi:xylulokinase [Paraburkholderia acidicola]|uniref:Xylulose kinase n=1 Tax=Paraburkholderia acidicola TaxID=1912599 RepID=A0A2A4EU01_9BURK|nr:xylulokinase [Paraburkholderia acidicola]PCE23878.1 xylulokinase [Paraburkholderia acidicola]